MTDTGPRWPTTRPAAPNTDYAQHRAFAGRAGRFDVYADPNPTTYSERGGVVIRAPSSATWHVDDIFYAVTAAGIELCGDDGRQFPLDLDPTPAEMCDIFQLLLQHHKDDIPHDDQT